MVRSEVLIVREIALPPKQPALSSFIAKMYLLPRVRPPVERSLCKKRIDWVQYRWL